MVYQTSLASSPYPRGVSEFEKAGFTPIPSQIVKPARVKESPVQLECKVFEVKEINACNLVMCEIVMIHINENVLGTDKQIDQQKIDLVARMGGNWYCRAHGDALFEIEKPITTMGIGVDQIPGNIKNSDVFTGNNLGQLGNVEQLPNPEEIASYRSSLKNSFKDRHELHLFAKHLLEAGKVKEAWMVLLGNN